MSTYDLFKNWLQFRSEEYSLYGSKAITVAGKELFWKAPNKLFGKYIWNYGYKIFEEDWDVLILLDGCRWDLMQEVAPDYDYIPEDVASKYSVGSYTDEWIEENFTNEFKSEMKDTIYISGHPKSSYLSKENWKEVYEPWRFKRDDIGVMDPKTITDLSLDVYNNEDFDRMIIHYIQPHQPFRTMLNVREKNKHGEEDVWRLLQYGEYSYQEIWEAYRDNLEWVLEYVSTLSHHFKDDETIITSDHGNSLGEWGMYGHSKYITFPSMKRVPWVKPAGHGGEEDYSIEYTLEDYYSDIQKDSANGEVKKQLEALGYKT